MNDKKPLGRPKTMMTMKRVILNGDGTVAGRGQPSLNNKENRTAVYINIDETYNVNIHGKGEKYETHSPQFKNYIKRIPIESYVKLQTKA